MLKGKDYYITKTLIDTDITPKYYVYVLVNPDNNTPFYVGKGEGDRYKRHVRDVMHGKICNGSNGKLFRTIKDILDNNKEPVYDIVNDNMTELDALALEAAVIDYYGIDNLCNYQLSGFGCTNHTKEMKDKISKNTKAAMDKLRFDKEYLRKCAEGHINQVNNYRIKRFGSLDNYNKHIELQTNLKLLSDVMHDITKELKDKAKFESRNNAVKNKQRKLSERLIITCDKTNDIYIRLCPTCKKSLRHKRYVSLQHAARQQVDCRACVGKKNALNHIATDKAIIGIERKLKEKFDMHLYKTLLGMKRKTNPTLEHCFFE